jgi:hypothetical protein
MQSWMAIFGPLLKPEILSFSYQSEPVGVCLIIRARHWYGFFPVTRLHLNAGHPTTDGTCLEFNDLPCRSGWELRVATRLAQYLQSSSSWNELALPGFRQGLGLTSLYRAFGNLELRTRTCPSPYIDLNELRYQGVKYDQVLSGNTRRQIRRSASFYERQGSLTIQAAGTLSDAQNMLTELALLHQRSWTARGERGAFSSDLFCRFHRELIERAFPRGEIQLLRVASGHQTVGLVFRSPRDHRSRGSLATRSQFNIALKEGAKNMIFLQVTPSTSGH